jgi:hypothetical protein
MSRWKKVEDLQSIRAENFNAILNNFRTWLEDKVIPDWLMEKIKHISKLTSQSQKQLALAQLRADSMSARADDCIKNPYDNDRKYIKK